MADAFAQTSPKLARWGTTHGWLEVGDDGRRRSFVRVLDEGGLIWEGAAAATVDDVLRRPTPRRRPRASPPLR